MASLPQDRFSKDSNRAVWAVADQCAVSAGNFLSNLILLRILLPVDFGTYALMLSAIVFFSNMQQALIIYPLCVRGARASTLQFRRLVGFGLIASVVLACVLFGPALSIFGLSLGSPKVILAAVSAMLFWQSQDAIRASFIAKMEQRRALIGDAISYLGQAAVLALASFYRRPTLVLIFSIAVTSLAAMIVQCLQIRPLFPPKRTAGLMAREFWNLGRWSGAAKVLGFLTLQAFPWFIVMRHGRMQVAAFQALFQFLAFTNPILFSIGSLLTTTVAKHKTYLIASVRRYLLLAGGAVGLYLLILAVAGTDVMKLLYGKNSVYLAYAPLMRLFAIAWTFEVVAQLSSAILGGLRQPRSLFLVQMSGAIAAVMIALPWTYWSGISAVGLGLLIVNAVRAATGVWLLWRHKDSKTGGIPKGEEQVKQRREAVQQLDLQASSTVLTSTPLIDRA